MECINIIDGPEIPNKNLEISTMCIIKDCSLIAVGTDIGKMFFWDLNRCIYINNTYEKFFRHKMSITSIKDVEESPKEKKIMLSSSEDGLIIIWEIECIQIKEPKIRKLDEKVLIKDLNSFSKNKKIQELLPIIEKKSDLQLIYNHRYVPQIKSIINTVTYFKNNLSTVDNDTLEKIDINLNLNPFQINVIAYTNLYKNYLYSGGNDCVVHIWDFQKLILVKSLHGHKSGINCMTFDKYYLFTGSQDGQIFIWNVHDSTLLTTLGKLNFDIKINDIMMIQKFGILVSTASDKKINFWKYETKELIKTITSKQECLCFNIVESYGKMICGTTEKIIWELDLAENLGDANIRRHYKQTIEEYSKDIKSDGIIIYLLVLI